MERRFSELSRATESDTIDPRRIQGVVMRYGSIGYGPLGPERFESRAFGDLSGRDLILNVMHDPARLVARQPDTLKLIDSASMLSLIADPPNATEANDAVAMVKARVLRGLSVEFNALQERQENGVRVISRAQLVDIGLVDRPAYPESEARRGTRQRLSIRMRGLIPYGRSSDCGCHQGECNQVRILEGAFDGAMQTDREILVIHGDYSKAVGSKKRGSLTLNETDEGLEFETSLPDSTVGRDLVAQAENVPVIARPYFTQADSEYTEDGNLATYKKMALRAILIGPTDAAKGWDEVRLVEPEQRQVGQHRRQAAAWL